jgi:hypothetical protein
MQVKHGTVLVTVNQRASIGALPLAVARGMGCPVTYLLGLTRRRIADLYPGEAKTDGRGAFIIADAARTMPHTLRAIDGEDETIAELEMIVGFDDDLAGEATRGANRLHSLLTRIRSSLDRVLGPRLQRSAVLMLLEGSGHRFRCARPDDGGWSLCCGRRHRGWPSGWSRRSRRVGRADRHRSGD